MGGVGKRKMLCWAFDVDNMIIKELGYCDTSAGLSWHVCITHNIDFAFRPN
jgi:hypothetical protein